MSAVLDRASRSDLEDGLAATPLLRDVSRGAVKQLAEQGSLRLYRRGTYLFFQGDDSDSVMFLLSGRVEVSSVSVTGHRQLLTTLDQPQFFGELGALGEQRRTATAMALQDCTVWVITGHRFMDFLSRHFDAPRALLRTLAAQIQAHESFVEDLLFLDLKGRVAKRL